MKKIIVKSECLGEVIKQEITLPWSITDILKNNKTKEWEGIAQKVANDHIRRIITDVFKAGVGVIYDKKA